MRKHSNRETGAVEEWLDSIQCGIGSAVSKPKRNKFLYLIKPPKD
jgi:hypothetical protein